MNNCRGSVATISLENFRHNIKTAKAITGNRRLLLPIKADAYGHGAAALGKIAQNEHLADMLGVASIEEGAELRNAGVTLPILLLGLFTPSENCVDALLRYNLTASIADEKCAELINSRSGTIGKIAPVHLKIDTGMGRIGCRPEEAYNLAEKIKSLRALRLEGVFSHMPVSDEYSNSFNVKQIEVFRDVSNNIRRLDPYIIAHIANSGAVLNFPLSYFDMVRPGIMCYGYSPSSSCKSADLRPAMTLKSKVVFNKKIARGTFLSYGHTYAAEYDMNIATVPIGYGDGYSRLLSNKAKVLIDGKIFDVVGRVCMDQILVNTGRIVFPEGEDVILFGDGDLNANVISAITGSIPYEVTCNISKRIPREYI